ncbi:hypothetical protein CDAR_107841 [Caerostris darwini]|uniref:Uncharacterized protein n=1 Tax=Caerostris darwini TaxID=1538125 RepID=A0AAV4QX57_9ARAC|nr:hypothetical protein CDAR_107841 [Caerostris darwini]
MICWYAQMSNVEHSQCRAFVVIRCRNGRYITADSTLSDVLHTGNRCHTTPNVTVQFSSNLCRSNSKGFSPFKFLFLEQRNLNGYVKSTLRSIFRFIVPIPALHNSKIQNVTHQTASSRP